MTHPPIDDKPTLLTLARNGDLAAFSSLIEAEQSRLMAQAQAFCADPHLAEDLVQETMIAAWKNLHRFDGSCRLFTWLYVILLRQHRRSLGWFSRRLPLATLAQQEAAERRQVSTQHSDAGGAVLESAMLRKMISALPARHREIVRLRYYADANESEIAAALGISKGPVKSRLHNALEKLRRMKEKVNCLREFSH